MRREQHVRRAPELHAHFTRALRQIFSRAQIKRNVRPAPVVNEQSHGDVSLDGGIGFNLRLVAISGPRLAVHFARGVLAAHDVRVHLARQHRADGLEQFDFFIANGFSLQRYRRFHRHQREHLQQMVLHHVAQRARLLVVTAPRADAEFLAHRDLHVVHRLAVPELLENGV